MTPKSLNLLASYGEVGLGKVQLDALWTMFQQKDLTPVAILFNEPKRVNLSLGDTYFASQAPSSLCLGAALQAPGVFEPAGGGERRVRLGTTPPAAGNISEKSFKLIASSQKES